MTFYYVYAIKSCKKNYIYIGLTNNPRRRIAQHNEGRERTTRSYAPFRILLIERFNSRQEARRREKYLKSGIGREYLRSIS